VKPDEANPPTEVTGSRARIVLYTIAALISLAGLADATYLAVAAMTGVESACSGSPGCLEVLGSAYARIAGVPVAFLGVWGYFAAFGFATFAGFGYRRAQGLFSLTVCAMFVMTLWLLFVQAFLLHAFCRYCLFSAAFTFLLAGLVVAGLPPRNTETEEEEEKEEKKTESQE
jgi:uncharacterized membrane protein